jgi:hypothetical protein
MGRARKVAAILEKRDAEWLCWAVGSIVFAHALNLISVTYFDQMGVVWYFFLAIVAAFGQEAETTEVSDRMADIEDQTRCSGRAGAVVYECSLRLTRIMLGAVIGRSSFWVCGRDNRAYAEKPGNPVSFDRGDFGLCRVGVGEDLLH